MVMMEMYGSSWPATMHPRAYSRGFAVFFFPGCLLPTPRHADNLVPRALFPGFGGARPQSQGKAPWGRGWHAEGDNSPPPSSWSTSCKFFGGYIFLRAIEPFEPDQGYGPLEIVGPPELRKRQHENRTGVNWGEKGRPFSRPANFSRAFYFRVFLTIWEPGLTQSKMRCTNSY